MRPVLLLTAAVVVLTLSGVVLADPFEMVIDDTPSVAQSTDLPAKTEQGDDGRTIDIVGDTSNSSSGSARAKGNAYRTDVSVTLDEVEFYLNFGTTQTLVYYVFSSPVEFGTYTEIYRDTEMVTGSGAGWYSSGTIAVPLTAGSYYIIAVSWDGSMMYYFGVGDSQATSFGSQVHGYAIGFHPLPGSFDSTVNDQAIYHQRLMTTVMSPVEQSTWGKVKALYR
jgi:hypothetical protein